MRLDGRWHVCDDEVVRPTLFGEVQTAAGAWVNTRFLLDTGADRSVLSADILARIGVPKDAPQSQIAGVGGVTDTMVIHTTLRFSTSEHAKVTFKGLFRAVTNLETLDMSVLGRDVTDLFAVIFDRPQDLICLVSQAHGYTVHARS